MSPKRWVIFGAVYAQNLGDGVIAQCLRHGLKMADPGSEVVFLDISGRANFGDNKLQNKAAIQKMLRALPRVIGITISAAGLLLFLFRHAVPVWRGSIRSGDTLIIGGGQLLLDYNMNFPLKIALIDHVARSANVPICLYAVGVSRRWSAPAKMLFQRVVKRAANLCIAVRDDSSLESLKFHLPRSTSDAVIALDPGLLARDVYAHCASRGRGIGVNLSDPAELGQYTDGGIDADSVTKILVETIKILLDRDHDVTLFTNGAMEDDEYMQNEVLPRLGMYGSDSRLLVLPRPITPDDLVSQIKGLEVLVAYRLHAHIVAFAHGIPAVGLEWDQKLRSFMSMAGLEGRTISPKALSTEALVCRIAELRQGDLALSGNAEALRQKCQNDINLFVKRISLHVNG